MRWLDAFLPELFYGALVSVAVLVVAWALLETWDPHREFIAEARAHADGPVGKPPVELERLNEHENDTTLQVTVNNDDDAATTEHDWPGEVSGDDDQPWFDAGTARLQQALADDTKRLQSRGIEEGTQT